MIPIKINSILFFLLAASSTMLAQRIKPEVEITIDGDSRLPDKYAPFDQWFTLNIPIDSSLKETEVKGVTLFELERGSKAKQYVPSTFVKKLSFVKTGTKYNTQKMLAPPLRPNGSYVFSVQYAFKSLGRKLQKVNELLAHGNAAQAEISYNEIRTEIDTFNADVRNILIQETDNPGMLPIDWDVPTWEEYEAYYNSDLAQDMTDIDSVMNPLDSLTGDLVVLSDTLERKCSLCAILMKCNCENSFIVNELKLSLKDLLLLTCGLEGLSRNDLARISQSQTTLDSILLKTARPGFLPSLEIRLRNLGKNIRTFAELERLMNQSTLIGLYNEACRDTVSQQLGRILTALRTRQSNANAIWARITTNINRVVSQGIPQGNISRPFAFVRWSLVNSSVATLKADAGNYFIPEVGLAFMSSFATASPPTLFVRPYLGVNISFRPINKDIRFKDIQTWRGGRFRGPDIGHRLSATLGVTKYSIATNHPEIGDLLKEMCLLTGLNYRVTRALRFGTGTAWYKKDNGNPLLREKTLIMPYVSVALDVDVVSWASSVTDLLIK